MSTPETNTQQPQAPAAPLPPAPTAVAPASLRRSPGLALVLSCFPGLGHLYLGLYQRAFAIFVTFAITIWLSEHVGSFGVLTAAVVLFAFVDAYRQAQALNLGLTPEPVLLPAGRTKAPRRGSLGFGLFLLIIGAFLLYNQFYPIDFSFLQDWWPLLLVVAGLYLVGAHLLDRARQRKREEAAATLSITEPDRH